MQEWLGDFNRATRVFRRSPGFATIIVVTLGLGIGANSAIFSVVNGVLIKPLPYSQGDRLVRIQQNGIAPGGRQTGFSPIEVRDYNERASSLTDLVEYHTMFFNLLEEGEEPERVQVGVASFNYFEVMGVPPIHGRTFNEDENHLDSDPVLVLGYDYFQRRFGGDPSVIGRMVEMNNRPHEIVGVLPPIPTYPNQNDVWMPWYACPFRAGDGWNLNRAARSLLTIGRVADGASVERVEAELGRIAEDLRAEYSDSYRAGVERVEADAVPLKEELTAAARPTFLVLLGMSGLVLLIACANVANLTLARMNRRQQELAVRAAMGAGRGRIVRYLVSESLVLSLTGAALAVLFAYLSVDALAAFANGLTPRFGEIRVDGWVLAFTALVAVLTGLTVGGLPGVFSRGWTTALRESKGSGGRRRQRVRSALVVGQVAVAFVLLTGAGLMIRSFQNLMAVDPGYDSTNVLTVTIDLDWAQYTTPEGRQQFFRTLLAAVREKPGAQAAAMASDFPSSGGTFQSQTALLTEGMASGDDDPPRVNQRFVTDGYFEALGIPLLRGRYLTAGDDANGARVAVLSESAARRFFGNEDPIGRQVSADGGATWAPVVGVVGDVRQFGLESELNEEVYFSFFQTGFARRLLVKTAGDPSAFARPVTEDVYAIDSNQPVSFVQTLAEAEADTVASPRTVTILLVLFAFIALVTAAAGILSVITYSVSQRQREIGIRMALGAERQGVLWMVLRSGLAKVGLGLAVGAVAALLLGDVVRGLLFGLEPSDPVTFLMVGITLLAVAVVATFVPAARGTRVDPMVAFRAD